MFCSVLARPCGCLFELDKSSDYKIRPHLSMTLVIIPYRKWAPSSVPSGNVKLVVFNIITSAVSYAMFAFVRLYGISYVIVARAFVWFVISIDVKSFIIIIIYKTTCKWVRACRCVKCLSPISSRWIFNWQWTRALKKFDSSTYSPEIKIENKRLKSIYFWGVSFIRGWEGGEVSMNGNSCN